MSVENNKSIIRDFIEKVWNNGNYELIPHFIADNYIAWALGSKKNVNGVEGVLANVKGVHKAYAQFKITIEDMFGENDRVVSRLILHSYRDSKEITMREIIIHRIQIEKIVEAWSLGSQWD
ncbi:MAG TPA: ester cyclase [Chloroflexia bacterium]|nr:ester cyclase [Chloroflexia bacterium]